MIFNTEPLSWPPSLPQIASDGLGGTIITWGDARIGSDNVDIYAERINADGFFEWGDSNGVAIQFFTTQAGGSKGAYDTVPPDDQSDSWDDGTLQRWLVPYTIK